MTLLPLKLGVRRMSDTERGRAPSGVGSKKEADKVIERDGFTCRFCGFQSRKYQRTTRFSADNQEDQTVTVCTFCEQCVGLERVAVIGAGALIWLPEIEQPALNHMARAIFVAKAGEDPFATDAVRALDTLLARRTEAKKRIGTADPLELATVLYESLDDATYKNAAARLEGIRFLPFDKYIVRIKNRDTNLFPDMIRYWLSSQGPYRQLPVSEWMDLFQSAQSRAGNA